MAGDAETGVTIHETVEELDAGPVAAQEAFPIGPDDDAGAVYARAAEVAARLLDDVLTQPAPDFVPQAEEPRTPRRSARTTGRSTSSRPAGGARPRRARASARTSARAPSSTAGASRSGRPASAPTGRFEPVEVQPDGGRRMTADAWLRGLR